MNKDEDITQQETQILLNPLLLLKTLGFDVSNGLGRVTLHGFTYKLDLSASSGEPHLLMQNILFQVYNQGRKEGKEVLQKQLRRDLGYCP